jgi:UDP-glucose 4-epimerase
VARLQNEANFDGSCTVALEEQNDFCEPRLRVDTDVIDTKALRWSEKAAWDELAGYYAQAMRRGS